MPPQPSTFMANLPAQPEIRPATAADLAAFYGTPPARTQRAWVAVLDGRPLAVCGVAYERGKPAFLFSEIRPEMKRYPKTIIRGARMVLAETAGLGLRAQASSPRAARLLGWLGLRYLGSQGGNMIFEWAE